jgi:hypothetical protein
MTDTVFRTAQEITPQDAPTFEGPADKKIPPLSTDVESPYSEFAKEKGHSYVLEYYELGHLVNRGDIYDANAFESEVNAIDVYLDHQIKKGEVNNTITAVQNELKRIEKMANIKKDARSSMKLELVAEYAKFLLKSEGIKLQAAKYGLA